MEEIKADRIDVCCDEDGEDIAPADENKALADQPVKHGEKEWISFTSADAGTWWRHVPTGQWMWQPHGVLHTSCLQKAVGQEHLTTALETAAAFHSLAPINI